MALDTDGAQGRPREPPPPPRPLRLGGMSLTHRAGRVPSDECAVGEGRGLPVTFFRGKKNASARQIDAICAVYSGFSYLLWTGSSPSPLRGRADPGWAGNPGPKALLLLSPQSFVSSLSEWLPPPHPLSRLSLHLVFLVVLSLPPPCWPCFSCSSLPYLSIYHPLCFCLHPLLSSLPVSLGPSLLLSLSFKDGSVPLQEI